MKPLQLLQRHQLRKTPCRLAVLEIFINENVALSHQNIEDSVGNTFDRVTIYRTLTTFEESGILHRVLDDSGQSKYALCREHCQADAHQDEHLHFKCKVCQNIYCLSNVPKPTYVVPKGYLVEDATFLLRGICSVCQQAAL
ncbi:Fur family transcriptional regulator [Hugenholtzia roseola]|uniref:Fur family transcriptional regulator n=1 Tax=Hugenholtzia roseola TaxID=1002 RepID=UPI0003FB6798|nr:transcriptional repressor [Hugenholtzia roseola]